MQYDFTIVFAVALMFSAAVAFFLPDKTKEDPELMVGIQNVESKLDTLISEVEGIKKVIEE
jgi:hypothetical protein